MPSQPCIATLPAATGQNRRRRPRELGLETEHRRTAGAERTGRLKLLRTCGLVAMTSASHAEGRQSDPGQVYLRLACSPQQWLN